MRRLTPLLTAVALAGLLSLAGCAQNVVDPYRVVRFGEMSEGALSQWEPSSAALSGPQAESLCKRHQREPGDPQFFLAWTNDGQRTLSCPVSQLGQSTCDSDAHTRFHLKDECGPQFAADSNDNISMRLGDGRIVTVFQTLERYCPGGQVHPSMPYAEAMGDGWGDDDERCAVKDDQVIDGLCGAGEVCLENCAELTAFDMYDSSVICHPAKGETCAPYYEQALYYTRVSRDCGSIWYPSLLRARELKYIDGTPFTALDPSLGEVGPVVAMDRVEGYADPFSDNAFLTTNVGPWGGNNIALFLHAAVPDKQTSVDWRVMFQHDGASPTVMTSVPHRGGVSRVYWFNCVGEKPRLYFADNPWARPPGALPIVHDLSQKLSTVEGRPASEYDCRPLSGGGDSTYPVRNGLVPAIARVVTDGINDVIRVVYPQLVEKAGSQYQSLRIVDVRVTEAVATIQVLPATNRVLLGAPLELPPGLFAGQARASVLWPEIIQADQSTEHDPAAATHLLHWTEVIAGGESIERFATWDPSKSWVGSSECPEWGDCSVAELWNPDHDLDTWPCIGECSPGDYQYGAFVQVLDECSHDFFVPWVRPTDTDGNGSLETRRAHAAMVTSTTDGGPPVFDSEPENVTVQCHDEVPPAPILTASDDCDPTPQVKAELPIRRDGDCPDDYELMRSWTATDNVGWKSSVSQVVTVKDTRRPVLPSLPPTLTVECDSVPDGAKVTAADNCDPEPRVSFRESRTEGDCASGFELFRVWIAEDRCGNASLPKQQHIIVRDTKPPGIESAASGRGSAR